MSIFNQYNAIVFDCDGVILNSNKIKTNAFYEAVKDYGEGPAQEFVNYHVRNGGISRYRKFEYLMTDILKRNINQTEIEGLLDIFAKEVRRGLMTCPVAEGLDELRSKTLSARWLIVSGGDQSELREIFAQRELDHLFDGGIFGSPDTKDAILSREIKLKTIGRPGLFIGDSKYDYLAAEKVDLDFMFLKEWSEFSDYKNYFLGKKAIIKRNIKDLLALEREDI